MEIKKQYTNFFANVKLLNNTGLDPKFDLDNDHVTVESALPCLVGENSK